MEHEWEREGKVWKAVRRLSNGCLEGSPTVVGESKYCRLWLGCKPSAETLPDTIGRPDEAIGARPRRHSCPWGRKPTSL